MKPNVIIVQPVHVDFPLFRYNLYKYQNYFGDIHMAFSRHGLQEDYSAFIADDMRDNLNNACAFHEVKDQMTGDWRSNAVNAILTDIGSGRVLFLEQDFLPRDERLFEVALNPVIEYNTVFYNDNGRIHPAFCLTDRPLIEATSKDFGARPPLYDHFGLFFEQLRKVSRSVELSDLNVYEGEDFKHLAGLTNNYQRMQEGQDLYKPSEFLTYNKLCLSLPVKQDPEFRGVMQHIAKNYFLPVLDEEIVKFFPRQN